MRMPFSEWARKVQLEPSRRDGQKVNSPGSGKAPWRLVGSNGAPCLGQMRREMRPETVGGFWQKSVGQEQCKMVQGGSEWSGLAPTGGGDPTGGGVVGARAGGERA